MANASEGQPQRSESHSFGGHAGAQPGPSQGERHRAPMWVSVVLITLTCVGLLATTLTLWTEATVLNTDRFVAIVEPLGSNPQVIDSVSHYVADQAVIALDIPGRTASVLPARGQFLVGPLEQSVHDFVQTRTAALLASDKMQATWRVIERSTHAELVAALRGQSSTVTIKNGVLSVDLLPVIAATLRQLQQADPALIPSGWPIPDLSDAKSPTEQRQVLSQALGTRLPPDFGVVTVLQSDTLATAQRVVSVLDILRIVLPITTLAAGIAAVWSATDRRRAWLWLGIGTAVATAVTILLVSLLVSHATTAVMEPLAQEIVAAVVVPMWANLLGLLIVVLIASLLVALVAHLAGKPAWLRWLLPGATA